MAKPRASPSPAPSSGSSRGSALAKSSPLSRSKPPRKALSLLLPLALVGLVFAGLIAYLETVKANHYIFNPASLQEISKRAIGKHGNDSEAIFESILAELREDPKLKDKLNTRSLRDSNEWVFNNAGGAMGAMYIIHASITEYLIFFGTPIGTEGHTGRHTADDYFTILTGEQRAYEAGALVPEVYPPGSQHHLRRGVVKQYMMPESGCWALELAQGWIPPMMPFGLADTLFSTLDLPTFWRTVVITAREMLGNLLIGKF